MPKLDLLTRWPSPTWTRILFVTGIILMVLFGAWWWNLNEEVQPHAYNTVNILRNQLAFSGSELESYHAIILDRETLEEYRRLQCVDFGFIIGYTLTFFTLTLWLARERRDNYQRRGFDAAFLFLAAGFMDLLENFSLLIALSKPLDIPDWLAFVYSSFAFLKWAFLFVGLFWLIPAVFLFATPWLMRKIQTLIRRI